MIYVDDYDLAVDCGPLFKLDILLVKLYKFRSDTKHLNCLNQHLFELRLNNHRKSLQFSKNIYCDFHKCTYIQLHMLILISTCFPVKPN